MEYYRKPESWLDFFMRVAITEGLLNYTKMIQPNIYHKLSPFLQRAPDNDRDCVFHGAVGLTPDFVKTVTEDLQIHPFVMNQFGLWLANAP